MTFTQIITLISIGAGIKVNLFLQIIIRFYNSTYRQHRDVAMSDDHLHILWASTVSVYVCAGMLGAFSCGVVADFFGR